MLLGPMEKRPWERKHETLNCREGDAALFPAALAACSLLSCIFPIGANSPLLVGHVLCLFYVRFPSQQPNSSRNSHQIPGFLPNMFVHLLLVINASYHGILITEAGAFSSEKIT